MRAIAIAVMGLVVTAPAYAASSPEQLSERVQLARQYVLLRHVEKHDSDMSFPNLVAQFAPYCSDPRCIDAVRAAAHFAADQSARRRAERMIDMYANGLTVGQLETLLTFTSSPEGQAVTRLLDQSEDQRRRDASTDAAEEILVFHDQFCAAEIAVCAASKALRDLPTMVKAVDRAAQTAPAR